MPVYLMDGRTDGRKGLTLISKEYEGASLMHYRTKGSKNGVRLYQHEDGSLTLLGRIHYGIGKGRKREQKNESSNKVLVADKWQNDDGSLTPEGYLRYGIKDNSGRNVNGKSKDPRVAEYEKKIDEAAKNGSKQGEERVSYLNSLPDGPEKSKEIELILQESDRASKQRSDDFMKYQKDGYSYTESHQLTDAKEKIDPKSYERIAVEDWLFNQISEKSGDWYWTTGKSKGFKKITDEINSLRSKEEEIHDKIFENAKFKDYVKLDKQYVSDSRVVKIRKQIEELTAKMPEQVLIDLGVPVNQRNLDWITPFVFWD